MKRWLLRLQGLLFVLLLTVALALAAWLTQRHSVSWYWGGGIQHELSAPSQRLLARMPGEVTALAFVPAGHLLQGHLRELFGRYAAAKEDFRFELINPDSRPDLVRQLGIERAGEIVVQYAGRSERIQVPTEAHLSAALERLVRDQGQFIAYLSGHGERDLLGEANHDLGAFGEALRQKGYQLQPLSLARMPEVPENAALLVVASPQTPLLPAELERLQGYLASGGNLLWLADPEQASQLPELAATLGLRWQPGEIVDPLAMATLGVNDARLVLVSEHSDHPATARLQAPVLFPQAKSMLVEAAGWDAAPLVVAADGQFLAIDYQPGAALSAPVEITPLPIGVGLARRVGDSRQRVVVVGDGDFISNNYLGNGANRELGLNLVDWLSESELFMDTFARAAPDQVLTLDRWMVMAIGFGFLLGVPGLCFGVAGWRWWRRRSG